MASYDVAGAPQVDRGPEGLEPVVELAANELGGFGDVVPEVLGLPPQHEDGIAAIRPAEIGERLAVRDARPEAS